MRRRNFIALLAAAAAARPLAAWAERADLRKVAVLMAGAETADTRTRLAAFRKGLAELGWKEGENVHLEYRWASGSGAVMRRHAQDLVALAPDVILANSTATVEVLKNLGTAIPVVFALAIDPVGLGHVQSLSRPGGNFTGFTFIDPSLFGKWAELLKEVAPGVTRAAVPFDPTTSPFYDAFLREAGAARHPFGIELVATPVRGEGELMAAIAALARMPGTGLILGPGPLHQTHMRQIAQLTLQHRLPAVSVYRPFVLEGGLMAYGPDTADVFRRSAAYVDRILKGANPAELPVQQPIKYELIVNLKAAATLGLEIPATLVARADEVIE
jgi:putative ABC transport system substrate-binding protein